MQKRKNIIVALALWVILVSLLSLGSRAAAAQGLSTADISREYSRAVVLVQNEKGTGSGFIISSDGLVVTAHHVAEKSASGTIKLHNGKTYWIRDIVRTDPQMDLAILKVEGSGLPTVQLGDSDTVQVGERVVVIGSPFGLENTVSEGIISAVRTVTVKGEAVTILQTTAPVSPGNSGGPVFNSSGEVIGIVSFQHTRGQNLNFAIPINYAKVARPSPRSPFLPVPGFLQTESSAGTKEEGYVIHFRDGRTKRTDEYWERGHEVMYRKYGGVVGINRSRIAIIENKADGTRNEYNPFYTKQQMERWRKWRRALRGERSKQEITKEQRKRKVWKHDALYGNIIGEAALIHRMYTRTVMMGLSPNKLESLLYSLDSLVQKLEYRADHGTSARDRYRAHQALLLMLDQMIRGSEVISMRIRKERGW